MDLKQSETEFIWHKLTKVSIKVSEEKVWAIKEMSNPEYISRVCLCELVLQEDTSENGLRAVLLQNGRPIEYASRNLRSNERGWSQFEKNTGTVIVIGLEKFDHYTFGRKVTIHNDHKLLEVILTKPLSQATNLVEGHTIWLKPLVIWSPKMTLLQLRISQLP
ncbi:uncharacterized protein [Palaemon carinicauda]|uniref:uncharacterized protein n=1 Tax=Palaemon carinicauda TaxID=392227 RepID=UPI0035B5F374